MRLQSIFLKLILSLSLLLLTSEAKVSYVDVKDPGLFYIFVNGQVILLDAVAKRYVKSIRAYNQTGIPFPNQCAGNPFNGTWNDQTLGVGRHTIFMSAGYAKTGSERLSGLTDALYVVDTESHEIVGRVSVLDRPVHTYYIPFQNSVWTHNDGQGIFTVVQASPPFSIIDPSTNSSKVVVGHGKLVYDERLGSKGFKSTVSLPGGYVFDLSDPSNSEESTIYLNFTQLVPAEQISSCGGTHGIGYSSISNIVYFGCIPNSAVVPGTVAIDGSTNSLVKFWNFTSSQIFTTPDQVFVIGLDASRSIVNLLYTTVSNTTHYPIQLKTNSTPSYLVVYPEGDYYLVFISLLNTNELAVVDFNKVVESISSSNTTSLEDYVTYVEVGYHNPPDAPSSLARYRPIDAGHQYVCVSALYEKTVSCYDTKTGNVDKYAGFENIQRIVFVEGGLEGLSGSGNVSITYDCSTAPTKIAKVEKSEAGSLTPSMLFPLLISFAAVFLLRR